MNNDDNLDLLDLNDDSDTMDTLPEATPFSTPRPKKPWLLIGVGVLIIILATYVIIRIVGGDSYSTMEVDLDAPAVIVEGQEADAPLVVPPAPEARPGQPVNVVTVQPQPAPQPVAQQPVPQQPQPQPVVQNTTPGVPVRVIEDRKEVKFNPEKAAVKSEPAEPVAAKPVTAKKTVTKTTAQQTARRTSQSQKAQTAPKAYSWYAQIGSYSTRALAEAGQRQLQASHKSLFSGHQFVILAAVLPNGTTTYRLRVGFNSAADANNFCRNAKADGLDCYVTK